MSLSRVALPAVVVVVVVGVPPKLVGLLVVLVHGACVLSLCRGRAPVALIGVSFIEAVWSD